MYGVSLRIAPINFISLIQFLMYLANVLSITKCLCLVIDRKYELFIVCETAKIRIFFVYYFIDRQLYKQYKHIHSKIYFIGYKILITCLINYLGRKSYASKQINIFYHYLNNLLLTVVVSHISIFYYSDKIFFVIFSIFSASNLTTIFLSTTEQNKLSQL